MGRSVRAAVSVTDIQRAYYDSTTPDQFWWWIREIRVEPAELIVDDDEGNLYRVPYTISSDTITFSEAIAVKIEYVDTPVSASGAPVQVAAKWPDAAASGRPDRGTVAHGADDAATITGDDQEVRDVKLSEEALQKLGLASDASEEDINAAILAAATGDDGGAGDGEGTGTEGGTTGTTEPEPTVTNTETEGGTTVPEGMVMIDQTTLDELKSGVAAMRKREGDEAVAKRDRVLAEAVRAGKFPKSRLDHYKAYWDTDPVGAEATIAALATGLVPVAEQGYEGGDGSVEVSASAYPESWKQSIKQVQAGVVGRVKVVQD